MEKPQKAKQEYDRLRGTYIQIHKYGVPVLFENMTEFVNWSFAVGAQYGQKLRRIDPDGKTKRQSLWYYNTRCLPHGQRAAAASKTFPGIAKAMAEQWGGDIRKKDLNVH